MSDAVFLSASVPTNDRNQTYFETAKPVAIQAAVTAFVQAILGRRKLVWGGHPAITPMIRFVAEGLEVGCQDWVTLYQSRFFDKDFPKENNSFERVVLTNIVNEDKEQSLHHMREKMFTDNVFSHAIFIGGMEESLYEFDLITEHQPNVKIIPVWSTGGATRDIADKVGDIDTRLKRDPNYVSLFYDLLEISPNAPRGVAAPTST